MRLDPDTQARRLGIFARTFARGSLAETLDAVASHGLSLVQLNLVSTGRPTLPDVQSVEECREIRRAHDERGITIAAVSGTFNLLDPDRSLRERNLDRLEILASRVSDLGCSLITLCTGTLHSENMWEGHPDNSLRETWDDLLMMVTRIAAIGDRHAVTFAFEPEGRNVVDSVEKARRLLDQVGSSRIRVVLDPANLLHALSLPRRHAIVEKAIETLGPDIALVHAKEIAADGSTGEVTPGRGVIDFAHLFRLLRKALPTIPIILHGLKEAYVPEALDHLRAALESAETTDTFERGGVTFRYRESGEGLPVVYQHGLGGDLMVPWGLYSPHRGIRLISFDARYHGETRPANDPDSLSFATLADDLLALLDRLKVEKAVVGGISMGAGLALNFAIRYPERTLGLILTRPAWLDEPFPENVRMFSVMADHVRRLGPVEGHAEFRQSPTYAQVLHESTDSASALDGMFLQPRVEETVDKYDRIPHDCPSRDRSDWKRIAVPTLVLANHQDPIHPWVMGEVLAVSIPGAELRELTPKCVDIAKHGEDMQRHMNDFLHRHFHTGRAD